MISDDPQGLYQSGKYEAAAAPDTVKTAWCVCIKPISTSGSENKICVLAKKALQFFSRLNKVLNIAKVNLEVLITTSRAHPQAAECHGIT